VKRRQPSRFGAILSWPLAALWRALQIAMLRAELSLDDTYYRYLERDRVYGEDDLRAFRLRIQATRCRLMALENS